MRLNTAEIVVPILQKIRTDLERIYPQTFT